MTGERRRHPRLAIALPIGHWGVDSADPPRRDFTIDVSPGGVHFNMAGSAPALGDRLHLELTIPPGAGYSPYGGKVRGVATVIRCQPVAAVADRWMVAARFDEPLNLEFAG